MRPLASTCVQMRPVASKCVQLRPSASSCVQVRPVASTRMKLQRGIPTNAPGNIQFESSSPPLPERHRNRSKSPTYEMHPPALVGCIFLRQGAIVLLLGLSFCCWVHKEKCFSIRLRTIAHNCLAHKPTQIQMNYSGNYQTKVEYML